MEKFSLPEFPDVKEDAGLVAKRDYSIDFVKGVLIVLMIYGHTERVGSMQATWEYIVQWIYSFHMPVFLIVSGYFFHSRLQSKDILKPLLRRLALPYVIFITLYLVGLMGAEKVGFHTSNAPPESIGGFLAAVFLYGAGALWFIHALIGMQLIFALSRYASRRILSDTSAVWFVAMCLVGFAVSFKFIKDWAAMYFVIGLVMCQMEEVLKRKAIFCIPAAVSFILLSQGNPIDVSLVQVGWVLSVIGSLMLLSTITPSFIVSLFAWLGQNTLIFLVSHALFTAAMKPFASVLTNLEPTGILFSGAVLTIALVGGVAIAKLLDATGLTPYLFGVRRLYVAFEGSSSMSSLKS